MTGLSPIVRGCRMEPRILLRKQVQGLRTLWDLRWHGENQAVATQSHDPQVSACPICHTFWSQAHVLCECPRTTDARGEGSLDLTLAVNRFPPGPMLDLGRQFHTLLTLPNQPTLMARRWSGQWDQEAIRALQPRIARCTRKQIKAVLGHIGRSPAPLHRLAGGTLQRWRKTVPP